MSASTSRDGDKIRDGGGGLAVGGLVVNRKRQAGNPVLKYVRNVRYEYGDCGADFECGPQCGVLYLALKYHRLHPAYIDSRLMGKEENKYRVKVLLALSNVEEPRHVLRELNMSCFRQGWQLVLAHSVEEAAEYIENLKLTEHRDPSFGPRKPTVAASEEQQLRDAAIGILTGARSVTKADAQRLLYNFGSLAKIAEASEEQLAMCPGLGPVRAANLYSYMRAPFST